MIEILESGRTKDRFTATCDRCECVFAFERGDAIMAKYTDSYTIDCPECGHELEASMYYTNQLRND